MKPIPFCPRPRVSGSASLLLFPLLAFGLLGAWSTQAEAAEVQKNSENAAKETEDPPPVLLPQGPFGLEGTLDERYLALTRVHFDQGQAVPVRDQKWADAFVSWNIKEGTITALHASNGTTIGGWFQGDCSFSYRPPLGQETAAVERGTSSRSLEDLACSEAFFLTDDQEALDALGLAAKANEATKKDEKESSKKILPPQASAWLKHLVKRAAISNLEDHHFGSFARAALERQAFEVQSDAPVFRLDLRVDGLGRPLFHPKVKDLNTLRYQRRPRGFYALHEGHSLSASHFGDNEDRYAVALTSHPTEGRPETSYSPPNIDTVSAELDLDIQVSAKPFAEMDATAVVTLTTRSQPSSAVSLSLLRKMNFRKYGVMETLGFEIEEVRDWAGRRLDFLHRQGKLLVRLHSPLSPGQAERLKIRYKGNAMPRLTPDSFGLLANFSWWPQPGHHDRFTWALNICTPKAFSVAGTGTTVESKVEGKRRCERWEEPVPITFPAVNMGRWVSGEIKGPRGIKIRAFFLAEDETQLQPALKETKRALVFYEKLLGPYPYQELDIAQARNNMGFWQAPAGLLELSKLQGAVSKTAKKDLRSDYYPHVSTATLSHEVAHQWWGHVVGWKSYRDQWISETFAEYSSFLYTAQHFGQEVYLGRLEYWEQGARRTDRYGPMVLGFRIGGGPYQGQVYRRGPYVLHMLRRRIGDDAFSGYLKTLCEVAANRNLSTEDAQIIGEKVIGPEVENFFERWIHQTGLPDLEVTYREMNGKLDISIRQTQPEAPFQLVVPLVILGKGKARSEHLVAVDGREWTGTLSLPRGFKKLLLDPDRELLTGKKTVERAEDETTTSEKKASKAAETAQ